jgi:FkbM family methyltransferase
VVRGVEGADSLLLLLPVLARRVRVLGLGAFGSQPLPEKPPLLYIDCGLHKRAEQVHLMHEWFADRYDLTVVGIEASQEHLDSAAATLSGVPQVHLHHVALVGPDFTDDEVRLYKNGGEGKGDSLFAERGQDYEVVPARRLSKLLVDEGFDLATTPAILRMNIEGAELYVIEDLLAAGTLPKIDGYYGMWDDLSKLDLELDRGFRNLLRREKVRTMTFNDRDRNRWRRLAIRTDIDTSIRRALKRKAGARRAPVKSA